MCEGGFGGKSVGKGEVWKTGPVGWEEAGRRTFGGQTTALPTPKRQWVGVKEDWVPGWSPPLPGTWLVFSGFWDKWTGGGKQLWAGLGVVPFLGRCPLGWRSLLRDEIAAQPLPGGTGCRRRAAPLPRACSPWPAGPAAPGPGPRSWASLPALAREGTGSPEDRVCRRQPVREDEVPSRRSKDGRLICMPPQSAPARQETSSISLQSLPQGLSVPRERRQGSHTPSTLTQGHSPPLTSSSISPAWQMMPTVVLIANVHSRLPRCPALC